MGYADTILHLSDLHFGADFGFPLEDRPGEGVDRHQLVELLSRHIVQELGVRVGVVVVSGDLITRGIFTSKADLARKIARYIKGHNKSAKPFKWTYRNTDRRIH